MYSFQEALLELDRINEDLDPKIIKVTNPIDLSKSRMVVSNKLDKAGEPEASAVVMYQPTPDMEPVLSRIAAYVFIVKQDEDGYKFWAKKRKRRLPGGGFDKDKDKALIDTVRRETVEESNVLFTDVKEVGSFWHYQNGPFELNWANKWVDKEEDRHRGYYEKYFIAKYDKTLPGTPIDFEELEWVPIKSAMNSVGINKIMYDAAVANGYISESVTEDYWGEEELDEDLNFSQGLIPLSYGVAKDKLSKDIGIASFLNTLNNIIKSEEIRSSSPDKGFDPELAGYDTKLPYLSTSTVLFSHIGSKRWPLGLVLNGNKLQERYGQIVEIDNTLCTLAAKGKRRDISNPILLKAVAEYKNANDENADHLYRAIFSGISSKYGTSFYVDKKTYNALYKLMLAWNQYSPDIKPRGDNTNTSFAAANSWTVNPSKETDATGSVPIIGSGITKKPDTADPKATYVCIASAGYNTVRVGRHLHHSDIDEYSSDIYNETGVNLSDTSVLRQIFKEVDEAEARVVINTTQKFNSNIAAAKQDLPFINISGCILAIVLPEYLKVLWDAFNIADPYEIIAKPWLKDDKHYLTMADKTALAELYETVWSKNMLKLVHFFGKTDAEAEKKLADFSIKNYTDSLVQLDDEDIEDEDASAEEGSIDPAEIMRRIRAKRENPKLLANTFRN